MYCYISDDDRHEKAPVQLSISPFDNVAVTKSIFRQHTQTECTGQGAIRVSLSKNVSQVIKYWRGCHQGTSL